MFAKLSQIFHDLKWAAVGYENKIKLAVNIQSNKINIQGLRNSPLSWFCIEVLKANWIVNLPNGDEKGGELGFRIAGVNFFYYKYSDPMVNPPYPWRVAHKWEFGDVVLSSRFIGQEKL